MNQTVEHQRHKERLRGNGRSIAYCLGFIFNEDMEQVTLQLKQRGWQKGKFNGIGGELLPGEMAEDAMHREFNEEVETHLGPKKLPWIVGPVIDFPGQDVEVHVFYCRMHQHMFDNLNHRTDEKLITANSHFLPGPLVPHVAWLVPFCREAGTRKNITIAVDL